MKSLPVRGAWIEIFSAICSGRISTPSLPVRGAWIEIFMPVSGQLCRQSLPVRGAWIEMKLFFEAIRIIKVAPRAGSVD